MCAFFFYKLLHPIQERCACTWPLWDNISSFFAWNMLPQEISVPQLPYLWSTMSERVGYVVWILWQMSGSSLEGSVSEPFIWSVSQEGIQLSIKLPFQDPPYLTFLSLEIIHHIRVSTKWPSADSLFYGTDEEEGTMVLDWPAFHVNTLAISFAGLCVR